MLVSLGKRDRIAVPGPAVVCIETKGDRAYMATMATASSADCIRHAVP